MEPKRIEGTTLDITEFLYVKTQHALRRPEQGEMETLMAVVDRATGEEGHILYYVAFDKRDVDEETFHTDNPKLFIDNHPEAYAVSGFGYGCEGAPKETSKRVDADHELEYKEGEAGWGLYLKKDE